MCREIPVRILVSCPVKVLSLVQFTEEKRANKQARETNKQGQQSLIEFPNITELINVRGSSFGGLFIIAIDPE